VKKWKLSVTADVFRGLPSRGRLDLGTKDKLDLNRLRARLQEKPRTKAGQVRQAWPDIKALLDAGHSLKDICNWLNETGIKIGYAKLSFYTGRLSRHNQVAARDETTAPDPDSGRNADQVKPEVTESTAGKTSAEAKIVPVENDPLTNIREREGRRPGFYYNSKPDIKKLI